MIPNKAKIIFFGGGVIFFYQEFLLYQTSKNIFQKNMFHQYLAINISNGNVYNLNPLSCLIYIYIFKKNLGQVHKIKRFKSMIIMEPVFISKENVK